MPVRVFKEKYEHIYIVMRLVYNVVRPLFNAPIMRLCFGFVAAKAAAAEVARQLLGRGGLASS